MVMMSKLNCFCIMFLLLLSLILTHTVARPGDAFHGAVTAIETPSEHNEGADHHKVLEGDRCQGSVEEEECMMRRTLEAQLDYIYTQKQNQP